MNKLQIIIALLLATSLPMMAEHVGMKDAQQVAESFLQSKTGTKADIQPVNYEQQDEFPNFYVFGNKSCFVIIAADDCVQPVLGYSTDNPFDTGKMPDNMFYWLKGYDEQIAAAVAGKQAADDDTAKQWRDLRDGKGLEPKSSKSVAALIQTYWAQRSPFNDSCPLLDNSSTLTGCVATAMAQIMNYWKYPTRGIGSHSYYWNSKTLTADFSGTTYDWANMANTYTSSSSAAAKQAVATLMYHCGVSLEMNYGTSESGANTSNVVAALTTYFNYSTDARYITRAEINNDAKWIDTIKVELDAGRPLQYSGRSSSGGGHSFICDGYDENNNLHINWGWGGSNAYYSVTKMGNYTEGQAAVFGIHPATIGEAAAPTLEAELVQPDNGRNVNLTWNTVADAASYQLYRNCQLIHSGTETSFTDEHIPFGTTTYFIRSVDALGNLSWPSNYESIILTFPAPDDFLVQQSGNGLSLSWSACDNAETYNLYCNGMLIASTENITYTDTRVIAGTLNYYVKGVNTFGEESEASDTFSISIPYSSPIVNDLSVTLSENTTLLSWTSPDWCYPETETKRISYANSFTNSYYYNGDLYWGHRYPSSLLTNYIGMKIYKASYYTSNKLTYKPDTYKIYVYESDSDAEKPSDLILDQTAFFTQHDWQDFVFNTPITIEAGKDYWVFIYNTDCNYNAPLTFGSYSGSTNGSYYSTDPTNSVITFNNNIAWLIRTYITDGTYTYNIYRDETKIAENLSEATYSSAVLTNDAPNLFTVKTKYYRGESEASNKAGFVMGTTSISSIEMDANDKMTITEGSKLTVRGTLSNSHPENLILENGAQLIHSSEGVKATVKRNIAAHDTDTGWNFIASPVMENITPSEENGLLSGDYDLYYYDEPSHFWKNHKTHAFDLSHKQGYLCANSTDTPLQFTGTLTPSYSPVSSNTLSYNAETLTGFNLVGNPFVCNATLEGDFYVINDTTSNVILPRKYKIFVAKLHYSSNKSLQKE